MNTKLMNSENSKTPDAHRLKLNLTDKKNLQRDDISMALSNCTWKNVKRFLKFFKEKTWDEEFEVTD